nr:putative integron gene cassette protein [uncultured bacterium]CAP48567.1 putative integron gene cassette protein [uncultured bacterium]CAP48568.1 putative integron gene cassette protein [uncultured bacterium]CAP48569.1 putative integron gene cassette protein [uncultured bacterium]
MDNHNKYSVRCQCGAVEVQLNNNPVVHAFCHCSDCRDLLNIPFHAVTAWNKNDAVIVKGEKELSIYKHPSLEMTRCFCKHCGETVFNTNVMDWRVISQLLISKCNNNEIPENLRSDKHFFYEQRVVDIQDELPKFSRGTDGPLYEDQH